MQPRIIITRPAEQAARFAAELEAAFGAPLPILIAPLMEIVPVPPNEPIARPAHVIFTSANGVAHAKRLINPSGIVAWCVGDRTAQAAGEAGFDVRNAQGDNRALVQMIIAAKPKGRMVHLRGAHVAGRIAEDLTARGHPCTSQIIYRQNALAPSAELSVVLNESRPLIVPLFSPRSAQMFGDLLPCRAPLFLVLMSAAVADAATIIPACDVLIAKFPDKSHMIAAILTMYKTLSGGIAP